jgi:WD40 repeat protein
VSEDKTLKLWKKEMSSKVDTIKGHKGSVYSLALSNDSKILISGSFDKTIKVWKRSLGSKV